ncbi:MAG TPA: phosphoribosylamine--glycine ligase [Rhabdochlamydiaceae bacterium]|nr:phosphoribosylamine--glycine ligase [Rhabdochlamydiaceae bacterium]
MKILLIGSGGREHAIAYSLSQSGHSVYCIPGNPGTEEFCEKISPSINPFDFLALIDFVKKNGIDMACAGPEIFLAGGMGDAFKEAGIPFFGPTREGALLESSKAFAKQFMNKYGIPTASFATFKTRKEASLSCAPYFDRWKGIVVKVSGLAQGKGVTSCQTIEEAKEALEGKEEEMVLEELLQGKEISLLAFCDGKEILPMLPSQDHKKVYNQDQGPNTGGMGAYAPAAFVTSSEMEKIQELILERTKEGLRKEGIDYCGILFFGLMLTQKGPMLLEYNCRFGDPEAQAVLPLLENDLGQIMYACTKKELSSQKLSWKQLSSCCVVMASGGYPGNYTTGEIITGLDEAKNFPNTLIFHAGTGRNTKGELMTAGGRVLGVTGLGATLKEATHHAYLATQSIHFSKAHFRHDIANQFSNI